jgi:hypothetical protein
MPKIAWINVHKEKIVKLLEAIVVILGIGSSVTLSTKHHIWGIWLGVAAVCVIAVVIGIILTVGSAEKNTPIRNHIKDAEAITEPSQQINVTSNNQQGGITAGIVNNNFGPQPRTVSESQLEKVANALGTSPKGNLYFVIDSPAQDGEAYAQKLVPAFLAGGFDVGRVFGSISATPPVEDIFVTNSSADPATVDLILKALRSANINARAVPTVNGMGTNLVGGRTFPAIFLYVGKPSNNL